MNCRAVAPRAAGVPADPEQSAFGQFLVRGLYSTFPRQTAHYLQVSFLVRRRESQAQPESGHEGEFFLHRVPGVYVVIQLTPVGETFPDYVAPVGGSVQSHVLRGLFHASLKQGFERLVLYFVLLERKVVHEQQEAWTTSPKLRQHPRQLPEVFFGYLD